MKNNLYSDLVNFYNVDDKSFKEFLSNLYQEMISNHRDVKYVKEHLKEEIEKKLEKYLVDGKFNINIEQVVEEYLNNNDVINDINADIKDINTDIEDLNAKLDSNKIIVTPEMFGAKGDGITDDYSALMDLFNYKDNVDIIFPKD